MAAQYTVVAMNLNLFAKLLAVPSVSGKEDLMMEFLEEYIRQRGVERCGNVWTDDHKNVYVVKGKADFYPCLSAHIDTVQPFDRKVRIQQMDDIFVGFTRKGKRAGIGADCKTGIMVCLEALERLDNVALCLFAYEEYGGKGANSADAEFFKHIGYVIEHDCPARHLFSYRNSGVRLFQNDGEFIQRAETTYADIVNGDERALHGLAGEPTPVAFWAAQSFHPKGMRYTTPKRKARLSVVARIDHGRWVVDCPTRRCCAAHLCCV